jgi:hypothetical protein
MFESGPASNDSNQTLYRKFRAFSGQSFLRKEKVIRICAHLRPVTPSDSGKKNHRLDFLGDFYSFPIQEIVRVNPKQNWHPITLYRSLNAKITSDVLKASLNNSFKDYWYLYIVY